MSGASDKTDEIQELFGDLINREPINPFQTKN